MRSISKLSLALAALLVAFAAFSLYLFLELGQRSETLDSTRTTLAASQSSNVVLQTEKASLEGSLVNANAQNAALAQANDGLAQDIAIFEGNISEALDAVDEWSVAYGESQGALQASSTAYGELEAQHTTLELAHQSLTSEHRQLGGQYAILDREHQTLTGEHRLLAGQYTDLKRNAGTLEALEGQVAALETEITELEAKRRPLILSTDKGYFACTGSMEPKITCLDEATFLDNPRPEEITVGTVIDFASNHCWEDASDDALTAHRVINIKAENGVYHYLPRGDANEEPDCWVPFDRINGYIIEIHKDVRPENAGLRQKVNEAEEKFDEAEAVYYELRDKHCPSRPLVCTLPSPDYERLVALRERRNKAWEYYDCWHESARNAIYQKGTPPLYRHCLKPFTLPTVILPSQR